MPWTLDPAEPHPTAGAIKQIKRRHGPKGIELDLGTGGGLCFEGVRLRTEVSSWGWDYSRRTFSLLLAVASPRQTARSMLLVTKWVLPSAIETETPEP